MRLSSLTVVALLGLVVLAGCSSKPAPTSSNAVLPVPTPGPYVGPPEVQTLNGTVNFGANSGVLSTTQGATSLEFDVANATLVYVELKWDTQFDLDLCVVSPSSGSTAGQADNCIAGGSGGMAGSPDSPVHMTLTSPEAGHWKANPISGPGGAVNVNYEIAVTQFHGETTVPAGFSALSP